MRKGLMLCANLNGTYPEKLDMMTLMSQMESADANDLAAMQHLTEDKDLPREERATKFDERDKRMVERADAMISIQGTVMFYMTLAEEGKDPAYYGKTVTPADADQVRCAGRSPTPNTA